MSKLLLVLIASGGLFLAKTVSADYELTAIARDNSFNTEHVTYQQYDQGVPVFGGQIKLHSNTTTGHRLSTGKISQASSINVVPAISAEEAISRAKNLSGQTAATTLKSNLYIFNEHLLNKLKPDTSVLVWQIELYQTEPIFHEYYFIDAQTGALVYQIHGLHDVINRLIYDCSFMDGDCYVDEPLSWPIYIFGRSEGQPERGENPMTWIGLSPTDTDDLYDNLGNIYDYYSIRFGRNGANGNNGMGDGLYYPVADTTGLTYIDYYYYSPDDYLSCPNAFFDGIGSMHYCNGFVTNDISGHEYAHAVNYFSVLDSTGAPAGLSYINETGALNEANSDVFGEALEYYVTGNSDWLLGEDSPLGVLRSMSNPSDYTYTDDNGNAVPYPDRYNSENLYCGAEDSGGVHTNSSVVNKAAYLMAMGGTFNSCTITALGRDKTEAIFYRAETTYYTTTTDFNGAYIALLAACRDLYSIDDCKQVEKALRATELNQAGFCSGEPAADPDCAAVDASPIIEDATSNTANGYYKAGAVIDIAVTFSEAVSGEVVVTLETGKKDQTCTFTIDQSTTGTCDYIVQAGDTSPDLAVQSITGTITDSSGDLVIATTPLTNLASNDIVIDTTKPTVPVRLKIYNSPKKHKRIITLNPLTFTKLIQAKSLKPYFIWRAVPDATKYYVAFTDKPIKRKQLFNSAYRQTKTSLRGSVQHPNKKYYLFMLLEDQAGNQSRVKTILKYRIKS